MFFYSKYPQKSPGFTLIEALITLTVFTIGIVGAFTFALTNMASVRDNFDRYLATNLAREGLEIVKNTRDSNWLMIDANDYSLCSGQPCTWDQNLYPGYFIVDYDSHQRPQQINPFNGYMDEVNKSNLLYINNSDNGFYSHTSGAGTTATNIYRTIQLNSICLNETTGEETVQIIAGCIGSTKRIGVQAIAHLWWKRANKTSHLEMTENLYNWRK